VKTNHYKAAMKVAKKMTNKPTAKQVADWKRHVLMMIGGVK